MKFFLLLSHFTIKLLQNNGKKQLEPIHKLRTQEKGEGDITKSVYLSFW